MLFRRGVGDDVQGTAGSTRLIGGDLFAEFISFIAHLQVASGEQPMVLPVGITGAELGLLPRTVSILIGWAIEDGLLILVEAHNFTQHRARSFRFALEKYPGIDGDHVNLEDEITIRLEGDQMVVAVDYSIRPVPRFILYAGPPVSESTGTPVVDSCLPACAYQHGQQAHRQARESQNGRSGMTGRSLKIHRLADIPAPSKSGPWGGWTLYPDKKSLHLLVDGNEIYGIRLDEITIRRRCWTGSCRYPTSAGATDKILADLVHALDQLFDPQKNFCPLGRGPRTAGIAAGKSLQRKFPIGCRARLICDPAHCGEVAGHRQRCGPGRVPCRVADCNWTPLAVFDGGQVMATELFEIGARVFLKVAPVGLPGQVIGYRHGKIVVCWSDLDVTFSHKADALLVIESGGSLGGREMPR